MDSDSIKDGDSFIDLERGKAPSRHEEGRNNHDEVAGFIKQNPQLIDRPPENWKYSSDERSGGDENTSLLEKKAGIDRSTKKAWRKSLKPPRPPKSPSLDSTDDRTLREISQLAMLKQARVERIKALKRRRNRKEKSSTSSNLCALVVTILFCAVIIWQGLFPKSTSGEVHGSPQLSLESVVPLERNLSSGPFRYRRHTGAG